MTISTSAGPTIAATELADRLAAGAPITVLDVREEPDWGIEGEGVTCRHVPAAELLANPTRITSELQGQVAVVCSRGVTAQPVAQALRDRGIDTVVVEGGMRGWIGALQSWPVELGIAGLAVRQVQRPGRGCLSYVLAAGGQALVVDPAPDAGYYVALAAQLGATVTDVVDTHLHADHLSGARELAERTGATLRLPAPALERGVAYADRVAPLHDGDVLTLDAVTLHAVALPGHTTDMTGLLIEDVALVGGDSLFADGIARPDLQRGDPDGARAMARTLHATLHERVLALGDDVVLLPGHADPGLHRAAITAPLGAVGERVPELALDDPGAFAEALLAHMPPRPANYEAVIAVNSGTRPFDPELETGGNSCSTR